MPNYPQILYNKTCAKMGIKKKFLSFLNLYLVFLDTFALNLLLSHSHVHALFIAILRQLMWFFGGKCWNVNCLDIITKLFSGKNSTIDDNKDLFTLACFDSFLKLFVFKYNRFGCNFIVLLYLPSTTTFYICTQRGRK